MKRIKDNLMMFAFYLMFGLLITFGMNAQPVDKNSMTDENAPEIYSEFNSTARFYNSGKAYYSNDLTIEIIATDTHSGVDKIYYSLNGKYIEYQESIEVSEEGDYTIKYFAIDKVGNQEDPTEANDLEFSFSIDTTAPKTVIRYVGPMNEEVFTSNSKFQFISKDFGAGVNYTKYSIDGGDEKSYFKYVHFTDLDEGNHTITFYSVDNVNNVESKQTFEFVINNSNM